MSVVKLESGSLPHLVRSTLDQLDDNSETVGHAVKVLTDATRELPPTAKPHELRRAAVAVRGGVLQILVSVAGILAATGKLELAADVIDIADGERPNS